MQLYLPWATLVVHGLREVVAYKCLDHIGSKFGLISKWWLQSLTLCFKCLVHVKSKFWKKSGNLHWEISFPCTTRKCDNITTSYYTFSLYYLPSSGLLGEVKNKRKFKTFTSKRSSRSHTKGDLIWGYDRSSHWVLHTSTYAVVKLTPEKNSGLNGGTQPWPLRHRWSALPTELSGRLGAGQFKSS